ncbi:hypothetical protein BOTBODRAFT_416390 [Botryobasidium botryosum FD-172 SS1]|uniref:Uncharacterized protein n=1 Tax=Botryobasidium botryosum (strain FD-172 SS1) TaxID=930990 RepID=A0A067MCM3_BOTB1|nr:hypothetical protein BOTBODRAFT_416390 [Botryobasidium botryosum FD-172 SS1]
MASNLCSCELAIGRGFGGTQGPFALASKVVNSDGRGNSETTDLVIIAIHLVIILIARGLNVVYAHWETFNRLLMARQVSGFCPHFGPPDLL